MSSHFIKRLLPFALTLILGLALGSLAGSFSRSSSVAPVRPLKKRSCGAKFYRAHLNMPGAVSLGMTKTGLKVAA